MMMMMMMMMMMTTTMMKEGYVMQKVIRKHPDHPYTLFSPIYKRSTPENISTSNFKTPITEPDRLLHLTSSIFTITLYKKIVYAKSKPTPI
jgi:hypothetical protein